MNALLLETTASTGLGQPVADAFNWILTSFGTVMTTIVGNPVLCLGIALWAIGACIGLFQRLV